MNSKNLPVENPRGSKKGLTAYALEFGYLRTNVPIGSFVRKYALAIYYHTLSLPAITFYSFSLSAYNYLQILDRNIR